MPSQPWEQILTNVMDMSCTVLLPYSRLRLSCSGAYDTCGCRMRCSVVKCLPHQLPRAAWSNCYYIPRAVIVHLISILLQQSPSFTSAPHNLQDWRVSPLLFEMKATSLFVSLWLGELLVIVSFQDSG